jgi:hypothetical protein
MPETPPAQSGFQVELRCYTHKADVMHTFALLDYPERKRGDKWRASICRRWWEHFGPRTPLLDGDEIKAVAS